MKQKTTFGQSLAPALLALALAGAALGVPALTARRQEQALLQADRPRPALGSVLWRDAVRQSPVLYALHRAALQGRSGTPVYAAARADADAVAQEAAALLEPLCAAGILDEDDMKALGPTLYTPTAAWRSTDEGRFAALSLIFDGGDGGDASVPDLLELVWHVEIGLPVAFTMRVHSTDAPPDPQAIASACLAMLGLDALGDWTAGEIGNGMDDAYKGSVCTSAAGQVRLEVGVGRGYMSIALRAEE